MLASLNGKTPDFDSVLLGSNPRRATNYDY